MVPKGIVDEYLPVNNGGHMSDEVTPPAPPAAAPVPNTSGQGVAAVVPDEIKKWSWAAFLMHFIWGIGNKTYIALLTLIPVVGIVMVFILGAKGNEWAWRNKQWSSIEEFKRVQKIWVWVGLGLLIVGFILNVLFLILGIGFFIASEGIETGLEGAIDDFDFEFDDDFGDDF